jgi:hypothetical protein
MRLLYNEKTKIFFLYKRIFIAFYHLSFFSIMFNKNSINSLSSNNKTRSSITFNWLNQIFSRFIRQCCIILPDENDSLTFSQTNTVHIKSIKRI